MYFISVPVYIVSFFFNARARYGIEEFNRKKILKKYYSLLDKKLI